MSEEDVEVVLRSFDVWNEWDVDAIRRLYTKDAVIQTPSGEFTEFGETDPIGRWVAELREAWAELRWEVERIFDGDDVVVSSYRATFVGRRSGVEVVHRLAGVYRIRDGQIASEHVYLDLDAALEAAGLLE
jgi:ketosteroid isomerase-like protein